MVLGIWPKDVNIRGGAACQKEIDQVVTTIRKYKGRSPILAWGLCNEQESRHAHEFEKWFTHFNNVCKAAKAEDPSHPAMPVVSCVGREKMAAIPAHCPEADIIGVNGYGAMPALDRMWVSGLKMEKPYLVTEYGPISCWGEAPREFGQAIELSSSEKALQYEKTYKEVILAGKGKYCLGGCAFRWGPHFSMTPY
jgi:hypothetical protein